MGRDKEPPPTRRLTGQSYEEWVWQQQDGWQWRFKEAAAMAAKARSRVGAAGWQ